LLAPFFKLLLTEVGTNVFNPWTGHDAGTDAASDAAARRLLRLKAHMGIEARFILVGEAAGYQGCHVTGMAFTSERLIAAGVIPRVPASVERLSTRHLPWSEPSATIVWKALHELGMAETTLLWNAYPWHPHKPGNRQSNRTPTPTERAAGLPVLEALLKAQPAAQLFAVGRNAEASLRDINLAATPLRHPAMGGATQFRSQLRSCRFGGSTR
jgi:uracil-DNA glycosylase